MIEIILLFFLAKEIGGIAKKKGLPAGVWKFRLVAFWILGEIIGSIIGLMFFGMENLFSALLVAIGFAATAYFLLKSHLSKLPDVVSDDDINNIGQ